MQPAAYKINLVYDLVDVDLGLHPYFTGISKFSDFH